MEKKAKKPMFELPKGLKVEFVEGPKLEAIKEKHRRVSPISPEAEAMSKKLLENLGTGASVQVTAANKNDVRKRLERDLGLVVARQKLNYGIRVIDEGSSLVFHFEQKRPPKLKAPADEQKKDEAKHE